MTPGAARAGLDDPLFGDAEIGALFADDARIRAMVEVEVALARVQGRLGIIPAGAAAEIERVCPELAIDPARLAEGIGASGVPTIALVRDLRAALSAEAASALHWGATSQDIIDTALVLRLKEACGILDRRLAGLIDALAALADAHRDTPMLARTRWQQALPTTFGLKITGWLAPLIRHRQRLTELRPRALAVQFGGAAGTLAALDGRGLEVMAGLAAELDLHEPAAPWHVQRDGLVELGQWAVLVSSGLGKIGLDVALLAQSEIAEVSESGDADRGGSSTMPQKANPVVSDAMVSIARHAATLGSSLAQSALAEHERGASAWQLEWLSLPPLMEMTAASLRHARFLADGMVVHEDRMADALERSNGLFLAEAAAFALARHMPMAEAKALVRAAAARAADEGRHLVDCLRDKVDAPVDWTAFRDPRRHLGVAGALIDRIIGQAKERKR